MPFPIKPAWLLLCGFFYYLLAGCTQIPLQSDNLLEKIPSHIPQKVELTQVPFYAQLEFQCGPSSLATVIRWSGIDITPDQLAPSVYLPERKGSLQIELIAATRGQDRIPYIIDKSLLTLLEEVQSGNPVLVMQNLGLDWYPQWHYAVVVGYDLDRDEVVLRSGTNKRHINTFSLFERTWRRADYWGMVVLPAHKLPTTATPARHMSSVVAFEKLGKLPIAKIAYQAGLDKWPKDRNYLMALGNAMYNSNDIAGAEEILRNTLDQWPDYAPAQNNLAHILMQQDKIDEAEKYAQQAIKIDDRFKSKYEETLKKILALKLKNIQ